MRLIINADDYAITHGVSSSIISLFEAGAVSTTSVIIVCGGAERDCQQLIKSGFISRAGVHLQTTGKNFKPILNADKVPSLVDSKGYFLAQADPETTNLEELALEWEAQINLAYDLFGVKPNHMDTHYHVHMQSIFTPIFLKLADKYSLPVRGGFNPSLKQGLSIKHTGPVDDRWSGQELDIYELKKNILESLEKSEGGIAEMVVHPGASDKELENISSWTIVRENDYKCLLELAQTGWFAENNIQLVTHSEL